MLINSTESELCQCKVILQHTKTYLSKTPKNNPSDDKMRQLCNAKQCVPKSPGFMTDKFSNI